MSVYNLYSMENLHNIDEYEYEYDNYKNEDINLFNKYCKEYSYFPLIFPAKKKIIAIGDLHGDYDLTLKTLRLDELIDENENWIGGDTFVVQVGDQVDNCRPFNGKCDESNVANSNLSGEAEDVRILKLFTKLNEQALKLGGAVISLYGNHEFMNVLGNVSYVSPEDLIKFTNYKDINNPNKQFKSGKEARIHAFKPGNEYAKLLGCTRVPAVIIGDFLFVHAGIINESINRLKINNSNDLYKISYLIRKWILGLITKENVTDIINGSNYSMFWNRILGSIPPNVSNEDPRCQQYLDGVLKIFKVDKMIIGHTPQYFINHNGINKTCDDKLWRVDFGGSFGFNKFDQNFNINGDIARLRKPQILVINDNKDMKIVS